MEDANGRSMAGKFTTAYDTNRMAVGTYHVDVTLTDNDYEGTQTLYFNINPKGTTTKTPKKKKSFYSQVEQTVLQDDEGKSNRLSGSVALDKDFTDNAKTLTIKGYKKTSKKIKGLASKKTYYVKTRTYIKVGSQTYYSN